MPGSVLSDTLASGPRTPVLQQMNGLQAAHIQPRHTPAGLPAHSREVAADDNLWAGVTKDA